MLEEHTETSTPAADAADLSRRAVSGAKLTLLGQWTKLASQLLAVFILARLLAPEDFGVFAMVVAITGFALVIGDFGLSTSAIQAKHLSHQQSSNLFWINTAIGLIAAAALLVFAQPIAAFYGQPQVTAVLTVLAANFILSAMTTQFSAHVTRNLGFRALFLADAGSAVAALAVSVALALGGAGVWALVAQKLTATVVTLVVLAVGSRWMPGLPGRARMGDLLSFGWRTFAVQVLTYVSNAVPMVVLGRTAPAQAVGFYERAQQLNQLPAAQLATPLTRVMLPVLSRHQDDKQALEAYLGRSQLLLAYAVGGVMAMMVAFADLVVRIALGPGWEESAVLVALLCAGGYFQAIAYVLQWAFLSTGTVGIQLRFSVVNRVLMIMLVIGAAPWGPRGVAAAVAIGMMLNWLVLMTIALPRTGLSASPLLVKAVRPLLVHVAAAGTAVLVMWLVRRAGLGGVFGEDWAVWAVGIVTAVLLYGGAMLAVRPVRSDVRLAVNTLRRKP